MIGLALRGLRHYWRTHLGVLAGTALATAVLTGALLVGDSVDYSLRAFATMRLGKTAFALDTRTRYVDEALPRALAAPLEATVVSALRLTGMALAELPHAGETTQVNRVEILGVDEHFWRLSGGPGFVLAPNEAAINEKLAAALGLEAGDEIALRLAKPSLMARDAPLSWRGDEQSRRVRCTVARIVPDTALGRFSLSPSQVAPYNAFVDRAWLQEQAELAGRVNLILVDETATEVRLAETLAAVWRPEHIGLRIRAVAGVAQLESDSVFLDAEAARAALRFPGAEGTLAYLVNSLTSDGGSTPYSFMVAGGAGGELRDDELVANRWLADRLALVPGARVELRYYELQASNAFVERSRAFTVKDIREMETLEIERALMPNFPGLSDVESCADWDVGMPMDAAQLKDAPNEAYWEAYRQTPKAFVSLAAGQAMWGNRFGKLTAVRFSSAAADAPQLADALQRAMDPAHAGLVFQPVRDQALAAVSQAMDFGGLFLGMSFFLIAAALMLTGLLFVFGVQQRAAELGLLLAIGFRPGQVRRLLLLEGALVALAGSLAGAGCGQLYTRALVYGLARYWRGAVAGSAIRYHAEPATLAIGAAAGVLCAVAAMSLAVWRQTRRAPRELLAMDFTQHRPIRNAKASQRVGLALSALLLSLAFGIAIYAHLAKLHEIAPAFFGAGALLLLAGLGFCRAGFVALLARDETHRFTLARLALQNAARRRGRSLAVVGLLACGCFLVFAVSAMQEDLHAHAHERASGTGGFALWAEATIPLLADPLAALEAPEASAVAIRVRDGADASCLNLNRVETPRLYGVDIEALAARRAFTSGEEDPWALLEGPLEDGAIPALVGDANTAMWTLKKKADPVHGDTLIYRDESGAEVRVKLVGTLPMRLSVFQGAILVSDEAFTRLYPSESGHRVFLIDAPASRTEALATELRAKYERYGLDVSPAVDRLLEFYAVETTYLAMFLVLGGLGLVIGGAGMGVVVLRNLLERRRELAMLAALGFDRGPIYRVLLIEYGFLLAAGLGIGGFAAAVPILPAIAAAHSSVAAGAQLRLALLVCIAYAACLLLAIRAGFRRHDPAALRSE